MIQRRIHETQIGLNRIVGLEIIQIHLRYLYPTLYVRT